MKTTKSIYLSALAALALTACSNDNDEIFDQSAAERLEQYKKEYAQILTADGGLWSMEYFSNTGEPGYVFVMKFDNNGSVTISANHKWIGGAFKQETSLWKMIADNGPVLSFNSYNSLFHIFSDPANIVGPDAPVGEDGDINETGYGHDGDYEFQFMEVTEDGKTVRLLGKKRLYEIYLRRLDPGTDIAGYLEKTAHVADFISPYFGYLNVVAADGEEFVLTGLESGIVSVYPKLGDAVTQTRTGNGIFTLDGFRFMDPLSVPRAEGRNVEPLMMTSFTFSDDGSLHSEGGDKIVGPYPLDVFTFETTKYSWAVDTEKCTGAFARYLTELENGIKEAYPSRSLEKVYFGFDVFDKNMSPCINVKLSGTKAASYFLDYTVGEDGSISFRVIGTNSQADTFAKKTKALNDFADNVAKHSFSLSSSDIMSPEVIVMTDRSGSDNVMVVEVE